MTQTLIPHPQDFKKKLKHIVAGGKEHLHVIADFDKTLTKAFVNGVPRSSLESVLQSGGYLGKAFEAQSQKNFDKYYPIEMDPTVPLEKKKALMLEWWTRQFALMLNAGLTRDVIKQTVQSDMISFRSGYEDFFDILKNGNIPLLIFSATGLGYEAIYYCLQNVNKLSDNINIISNSFIRDENGRALAVREPIIHSYNKGETVVRDLPIYDEIKKRKNILLLGDSPADVHMADGFDYNHILKIGFLNNDTPENRKQFQERFDLIILGDGGMDEVNRVLEEIM